MTGLQSGDLRKNPFFAMAKKTAAAPEAATAAAPKSTKKVIPAIPCALKYFWQYALLAWGYCRDNIADFAAERPFFTNEFIDGELAYINSTKELPNNRTRSSMSKEVRQALTARRQDVTQAALALGLAIDYAYRNDPAEVAKVQREMAGLTELSAASPSNWAAVSDFTTTGKNYLKANAVTLLKAGAINEAFEGKFESVSNAFGTVWNETLAKRKAAKAGTQAVSEGIERIKKELNPMLKLGSETLFKYDPDKRKLFTTDSLVAEVRGGHSAGISGRTVWAGAENPKQAKPIMDVQVEVLGVEGKSATTNKEGRFEIKIAGGEYTLRFTADGTVPFEQKVVVKPGVTRRLNVALSPAPVVPAPVVAAPVSTLNSMLNESLKGVDTANNGTATSSITANSTNGVAV